MPLSLRRLVLPLALTLLPALAFAAEPAGPDVACEAPLAVIGLSEGLTNSAARIAGGQPLVVLAIGSSSTEGIGASRPEFSYPSQLHRQLSALYPTLPIEVHNRGKGGETIEPMLVRMKQAVEQLQPTLVIWQTATNDLFQGVPASVVDAALQEGADYLSQRGIDLLLFDPQVYARAKDPARYEAAVRHLDSFGARTGVPVFHRYDLMRHWEQGGLPLASLMAPDQLHHNDAGYRCISAAMATALQNRIAAVDSLTVTTAALPR